MCGADCVVEGRPAARREEFCILPFRQAWQAGKRALCRVQQRFCGETFGQPVHRFEQRQAIGLFGREHVVRMYHLQPVAEALDATAYESFRARR